MDESLVWIPITVAELLLLVSVALGFLLARAKKAERQLRAQLEELEQAGEHPVEAPTASSAMSSSPPPPESPAQPEPAFTDYEESAGYRTLDELLPATEAPQIDHCIEDLQQRLHETSACLQRVAAQLEKERTLSEHSQLELADLRRSLASFARELTALRHANARLQQELRSKKNILDGAVLEERGSKDKILLYIKRLRDEITTLQLKLAGSEDNVTRLRKEKEALIRDYRMLTTEYERIYANFRK